MLNILVPTDFSELSKVAIRYALDMAKKMKGKVSLLHVVDVGQHAGSMRLRLSSLIDELYKIAEEDFDQLVAEVEEYNKTGKKIKHHIEQGTSFSETISRFARNQKANLIVVGTHGASGLKKVFMGSNTASLLESSGIPVLAVPAEAKFKGLKSIVYATDMLNTEKEFKRLLAVVKSEKPVIHIIHVAQDRSSGLEAEAKIDKIVSKSRYKHALVRIFVNSKPVATLDEYVVKIRVDMLAMFPHQYTIIQKLFKGSVTKEMTLHSNVPLLAFKDSSS